MVAVGVVVVAVTVSLDRMGGRRGFVVEVVGVIRVGEAMVLAFCGLSEGRRKRVME